MKLITNTHNPKWIPFHVPYCSSDQITKIKSFATNMNMKMFIQKAIKGKYKAILSF